MGGKNSYESIKRYQDKAYDAIPLRVKKGKKEAIKSHAEARGDRPRDGTGHGRR